MRARTSVPHHLVVGPEQHGVTAYASRLAAALDAGTTRTPAWRDHADVLTADAQLPAGEPVHVHVTDHLFGRSPDEAARALRRLAASRPVTLTLHDLPQVSDGAERHPRRSRGYAELARLARGVVVSSEHERQLLQECLGEGSQVAVEVVPLVVDAPAPVADAARARSRTRPRDVAMLGFVYPGKGHPEALSALQGLPEDVGLRVVGRASEGHEDLLAELTSDARRDGRRLSVTGFVPETELVDALQSVAVPIAAHRHVSASGSLSTWVGAGRRPLVPRDRYTSELADRMPGTLTLYDDLPAALETALADPASTWLGAADARGAGLDETAGHYREVLHRWTARR